MSADLHAPEAMVEAAARAEYAIDMAREESDDFEPIPWEQALPFVRKAYCDRARAGLTAALGVCTVEERRDHRSFVRQKDGEWHRTARALFRHLVITTPAEQVDTEEAPK